MMAVASHEEAPPASAAGVLPVVARPRNGLPIWVIVVGFAILALVIFTALNGRRLGRMAPAIEARRVDGVGGSSAPPLLYIPPAPVAPAPVITVPPPPIAPQLATTPQPVMQRPMSPQPLAAYTPPPMIPFPPAPPTPARVSGGPALVIDNGGATATQPASPSVNSQRQGAREEQSIAGERASAGVLANRDTTVVQGTLIPTVLETALDSSHPGLARAIVSQDIRGFDGTRVLIPRGSRLIGEYKSDAESGQNRMLVNWIRLIRPDGASIAIGSPAADTLGRGGVRASVDTHFFERFAGAILQSALDVGVNLASRSSNSPVVVALPGSLQNGVTRSVGQQREISPTLKVKAATSISVFVARDLDFTSVENP